MALLFKNVTANTTAVTLNVNGLGAKPVVKSGGTALAAGNLKAGGVYTVRYDGTSFILQGEGGSGTATSGDILAGKTASTDSGDVTGTMADRGAMTINAGTTNQTIPAGYHNGSGIVVGDPDLIAANILNTANIFNVQGTAIAKTTEKKIYTGTVVLNYTDSVTHYFSITGLPSLCQKVFFFMDGSNSGGGREDYTITV
jgi:hypothetical protein